MKPKKIIVVGASSGIGRSLALEFNRNGHAVGISGRRLPLLAEMPATPGNPFITAFMDVSDHEAAVRQLHAMIARLGGLDLIVLNAGVLLHGTDWRAELQTSEINANGFMVLANEAFHYFAAKRSGHIVGMSSIAGLKGFAENPAYCASKAFVSTYLQALMQKSRSERLNIRVTNVFAGFVITEMTRRRKTKFWSCSAETAARQIDRGIAANRRVIYVSSRWILVAWLLKLVPDWLFERIPFPTTNTYHDE